MFRTLGWAALALFILPAAASAETAGERLHAALAGNTVVGIWGPRSYTQYFDPDGSTVYVEQGRLPSNGTWRVTEDGGYCSVWGEIESCYGVELSDDRLVWTVPDTGETWPASIVPGRQLSR